MTKTLKMLALFGIVSLTLLSLYSRYGYLLQSARNWPTGKELSEINPLNYSPNPSFNNTPAESDPELGFLRLPAGFAIQYFAREVSGARSLAVGEGGVVYVGTRPQGVVYALHDSDNDGLADTRYIIASGLNNPNGVAYHNGDLYVAEIERIIKFENIDETYNRSPSFQVVYDSLPTNTHHGWRYIAFGPDSKLYVTIGFPCNVCDDQDKYGRIIRIDPNNPEGFEVVAYGVRNSVGLDWNPLDNKLWFTDNGRDLLGDDQPADELNVLDNKLNFGFPFCHQGDIPDPNFGRGKNCGDYAKPALKLGPHVAALGLHFYQGEMFPALYSTKVLIAEHGSWNRTVPIGYRIMTADIDGTTASNYQEFITGWLDESGEALGRPVDLAELPDGSLLISDDFAGDIYRVTYSN